MTESVLSIPEYLIPWLRGIVGLALIGGLFGAGMFAIWLERKLAGDIQERLGPHRVGKMGMFQLIADAIKLFTKEDIIPAKVDKLLYVSAPIVILTSIFLMLVAMPIGAVYINDVEYVIAVTEMDISVLYIEAVSAISVIGIFVLAYGQNNKYAMMGAFRNFARMVGYEVPLGITIVSVGIMASSLDVIEIVRAQGSIWFVLLQPLGFIVFFIALMADMGRLPFDQNEAEEELQAGVFTEYSGMRFGLGFFAEYFHMMLGSLLTVLLFFGGWNLPGFVTNNVVLGLVLPTVFLLLKATLVMAFIILMRWAVPRFRIDQVVDLSWKRLLPLSLLNLVWAIALSLYLGA